MSTSDFQPSVRTVLASFLFVDIVGFSKVPAAQQHALKSGLITVLHRHLGILHIGDFRLRDTGDGALLSFLTNPEHALYMALAIASDLGQVTQGGASLSLMDLRTGINLGAVKETLDVESRPNYVGDGINAAQRIMDFAKPGQMTASRSFMEAVSQLDGEYEALFQHLGAQADKHGRKHELFGILPSEPVLRRLRSDILVARPPQVEVDFDLDRLAPPVVLPPAPPAPATGNAAPVSGFASTELPGIALPPAAAPSSRRTWLLGGVALVLTAVLSVLMARWLDREDAHPAMALPASPAPVSSPASAPASAPVAAPVPAPAASAEAPLPAPAPAATPAPAPTASAVAEPASPVARPAVPPASAARPSPRKAMEAPRTQPPVPAEAAAPPALSEQASQRCSRIMQKVSIGEPLSADEKNILANSCR